MPDTILAGGSSPQADAESWAGELSALESRAEIDSLESLHVQRRQLLPEYAVLRALHGSNGKWDAKRKQMLEAIKVRVRMEAQQRGEKVTEGYIDALAHADDQYASMIDQAIMGATRYVMLDTEVSEIEERIKSREIELLAYSSEVRLAR
jgi:hypothetical protein